MKQNWREQAKNLFFCCRKSIVEIEAELGISRKTLSQYLKGLPGYEEERVARKQSNAAKRKDYKREWDRKFRSMGEVTPETIRREHDTAAAILSREKYR